MNVSALKQTGARWDEIVDALRDAGVTILRPPRDGAKEEMR